MSGSALSHPPTLLAFGDSVMWGQGLQDWNKFYRLVWYQLSARAEYSGLVPILKAHSGAIIGADQTSTGRAAPGEVPWSYPSIVQQVDSFDGEAGDVRVVLVNGGLNDVRVARIIDPETTSQELRQMTCTACYDGMLKLLRQLTSRFSHPLCRILVLGYYQILSAASSVSPTVAFLELFGITTASELLSSGTGLSEIVAQCKLFREQSDAAMAQAVNDINKESGDARVQFVSSGFTEASALFQPDTMLWGLDGLPPFLNPEDDLVRFRSQVCSDFYLDGSLSCTTCRFASVAHPTAEGALQYADQIMKAL